MIACSIYYNIVKRAYLIVFAIVYVDIVLYRGERLLNTWMPVSKFHVSGNYQYKKLHCKKEKINSQPIFVYIYFYISSESRWVSTGIVKAVINLILGTITRLLRRKTNPGWNAGLRSLVEWLGQLSWRGL